MNATPPVPIPRPAGRSVWRGGAALALGVLLLAAYGGSLGYGFTWDDHDYIIRNPFVWYPHNVWRLLGLGIGDPDAIRNAARPVWILSAMWDVQVWGAEPMGHHLTSLLLHGLNALLVTVLARAAGVPRGGALLGGAIFVAHPLAAEPVCNVSFRPDLLAGAGMASAALCAWMASRGPARRGWLAGLLAASLLALGSKETALVLPVLLLLWTPAWRPRGTGWARGALAPLGVVALGVLAAVVLRAPWSTYRLPFLSGQEEDLPAALSARWQGSNPPGLPWAVPLSLGHLLGRLAWPLGTGVDLRFPAPAWGIASGSLLLAAALLAAFRLRGRPAGLGLAWGLIAALPAANLVAMPNPVADRYAYVPMMGFALAAGALGWEVLVAARRRWGTAALALAMACALAAGRANGAAWTDDDTLWRGALRASPRSARVRCNAGSMAIFRSRSGRDPARAASLLARARSLLEQARALAPDSFLPWIYLADLARARGDAAAVASCTDAAVRLAPRPLRWLLMAQGDARMAAGDRGGALEAWKACYRLFPGYPPAEEAIVKAETLP